MGKSQMKSHMTTHDLQALYLKSRVSNPITKSCKNRKSQSLNTLIFSVSQILHCLMNSTDIFATISGVRNLFKPKVH